MKLPGDKIDSIPTIDDAYGNAVLPAEYMLVICLNEDVNEKIMKIKNLFASRYECPQAMHTRPQLILARFSQFEMMEQRLMNKLTMLSSSRSAFKLDILDFVGIPTHSIALGIASKVEINNTIRILRTAGRMMTINKENKVYFATEPSIIIANKLLPWQYEKAWIEYANTPFQAACMVNELALLKRKAGNKGYTTLKKFQLLNKNISVKQSSIF